MGLEAIAAAAEVASLQEQERARALPSIQPTQVRSASTLSDSTVPDNDAFESDSSGHATPHRVSPPLKKRRSDSDIDKTRKQQAKQQLPESFPPEMLRDLAGSTSAEVRRMTEDERALVHYKRRLRNRESAKRSRAKRQATISDIQQELEELRSLTANLVDKCVSFARANEKQSQELETLRKEKHLLESMLRSGAGSIL